MHWLNRRIAGGLALSTGAMAASTFGTLSFAAIAPFVRDQFDLTTVEVGMFTALVFFGAMIASVPAGHLTDHLGAPVMLAMAQAGVAGGIAIAALAPSQLLFLGGIMIAGLAYGGVNPPTNVIASDAIPKKHLALFLSFKQTGVPIGGLVASVALPSIAESVGWRMSLLVPIVVLLLAAGLAMTLVRSEASALEDTDGSGFSNEPDEIAPAPSLAPTALYGFIMAGVQLSFVGYLTVFLVDEQGFSPTNAGFALGVVLAFGIVGRLVWGAVSDRYFSSHATVLAMAGLGSTAGLILLLIGTTPTLWASLVVIGFCGVGWNGVYLAMVAARATLGTLGRATGSALLFIYAGVVLLPPLFGAIHELIGSWPGTWAIAVLLSVSATLAMALAPRRTPTGLSPRSRTAPVG
jgi:MFS family permease